MTELIYKLFSLTHRVAIVTGASRGIGAALADGLALAGAQVIALARSANPAAPVAAGVVYRSCDVTDESKFRRVCEEAFRRHGRLDILINSAGVTLPGDDLGSFDRTISVNLRAAYACASLAAERMKPAGRGSIINVTSLGSVVGFPGNPAYVAAKGGLRMLTKALANDLGPLGIRVNNLAPGYIRTTMTAQTHADPTEHRRRLSHMILPRWGEASDLVGAAIFLASDASSYVTGQDIFVDGGWTAKGLI